MKTPQHVARQQIFNGWLRRPQTTQATFYFSSSRPASQSHRANHGWGEISMSLSVMTHQEEHCCLQLGVTVSWWSNIITLFKLGFVSVCVMISSWNVKILRKLRNTAKKYRNWISQPAPFIFYSFPERDIYFLRIWGLFLTTTVVQDHVHAITFLYGHRSRPSSLQLLRSEAEPVMGASRELENFHN